MRNENKMYQLEMQTQYTKKRKMEEMIMLFSHGLVVSVVKEGKVMMILLRTRQGTTKLWVE
mgnify:CR=1